MKYYTPTYIKNKMNAIKRIRELHQPKMWSLHDVRDMCSECKVSYPCPTIEALDGKQ